MIKNKINKIAVIGSGVMGSSIAALIASSSHQVVLLDIASNNPNDKNSILKQALENLPKQRPLPLVHPSKLAFITIGNLEDDLKLISECDLIIEVIIEKLEIKHQLYDKILPYLKENAILASNTSTLPLAKLKANLPDSMQARFIITHFFNPPRYMELVELILDSQIDQEVIERISEFLTINLGKTIVKCNDTPGFIANRVGCYLLELVVRKAIASNLDPVMIDRIFMELFELPNTGIFGLYDLIGHDVMKLISTALVSYLPNNDDYRRIYIAITNLDKMIENNLIGRKGLGGFYCMSMINGIKTKEVIDLTDLSYLPVEEVKNPYSSVTELVNSDSVYGKFFCEILTEFYLYIISLIPEVTDNIYDIDLAIKLGYSWKKGPFELLINKIPGKFEWLKAQALLMNPVLPEYIINRTYETIEISKFHTTLIQLTESKVLLENDSAKLIIYQDRLVFIINTKMNSINENVLKLLLQAVDVAEAKDQALYITPLANYFSAGADLKFISFCIKNKDFIKLDNFLKLGQQAMMRLKYSNINIVSCAVGLALGGGCEILLHSDYIVANRELTAGLVEVGVGLVPGWGGVKEAFYRASNDKDRLVQNLKNILLQNKSSSANYFIIDYHMLNTQINMNPHLIINEAFAMNLPKKMAKISKIITLPQVILAKELDLSKYDNLQLWLIAKFQEIISLQQIDEQRLLQIEREIFLELAKNPIKQFSF
jgi:3-hydroxyacyl-CoA dehydrogenase/enoyl-CoA hydratase/3-hydroxybutyryl-CoA epimerase